MGGRTEKLNMEKGGRRAGTSDKKITNGLPGNPGWTIDNQELTPNDHRCLLRGQRDVVSVFFFRLFRFLFRRFLRVGGLLILTVVALAHVTD